MRENAEHDLPLLRGRATGAQGGAESSLVATEHALGMPALVVERVRKALPHRAAIACRGPAATPIPRIELDDGRANAQFLATEPMVVLGVIARVPQHGVQAQERARLPEGRGKVRRILRGPGAGDRAEDQVRAGVGDGRELRPRAAAMRRAFRDLPADAVVEADVPRFEPGGIHGRHRRTVHEAYTRRTRNDSRLGPAKGASFSASARSRRSA